MTVFWGICPWHAACKFSLNQRELMLGWTVTFLVVALIAALLGFTKIAGAAAGIAKVLFTIFLILFLVSLIIGMQHT